MKNNCIITLRTPLNRVPDYQGQPIIQENEHYREWLLCQDLTEWQAQEWLDEKAAELTLATDEPDMIDKGEDYLSYDNKTWKIRTLKEALDMGMMGNMRRRILREEDWLRKKLAEALDCDPDSINKELTYRLHTDKNYLTLYVDEIGDIELAEYADQNSREYYDYPSRPVAVIYKWGLGTTPCNCCTCQLYRDYLAMSKEEYDALYGQGQADTWITTPLYDTLTEDGVDDYISEIRKNIESIDWGYFVDEQ